MVETEADGSVAAGPEPGPDIQRTLSDTHASNWNRASGWIELRRAVWRACPLQRARAAPCGRHDRNDRHQRADSHALRFHSSTSRLVSIPVEPNFSPNAASQRQKIRPAREVGCAY